MREKMVTMWKAKDIFSAEVIRAVQGALEGDRTSVDPQNTSRIRSPAETERIMRRLEEIRREQRQRQYQNSLRREGEDCFAEMEDFIRRVELQEAAKQRQTTPLFDQVPSPTSDGEPDAGNLSASTTVLGKRKVREDDARTGARDTKRDLKSRQSFPPFEAARANPEPLPSTVRDWKSGNGPGREANSHSKRSSATFEGSHPSHSSLERGNGHCSALYTRPGITWELPERLKRD